MPDFEIVRSNRNGRRSSWTVKRDGEFLPVAFRFKPDAQDWIDRQGKKKPEPKTLDTVRRLFIHS